MRHRKAAGGAARTLAAQIFCSHFASTNGAGIAGIFGSFVAGGAKSFAAVAYDIFASVVPDREVVRQAQCQAALLVRALKGSYFGHVSIITYNTIYVK